MITPRLLDVPLAGVYPVSMSEVNSLLVAWEHRLGPVNRPFRQEAYVLELDGSPISLATSGSIVNQPVAGYGRTEVVELTRLCSAPGTSWATRVMLRFWRADLALRWGGWPVAAAVSYSQNAHHRGDVYRFDGWTRVRDDCGSMGGGRWTRQRSADHVAAGRKTLWIWVYAEPSG